MRIVSRDDSIMEILRKVKKHAQEYRALTGRPLGITGEVAEYEAARLLHLTLLPPRNTGYDVMEGNRKLQVKGRCLLPDSKPGQTIGSLNVNKDWHAVLLVLLDRDFNATEIYEARRAAILKALNIEPISNARKKGVRHVSKFKAIGKLRWSLADGSLAAPG